MMHINVFGSAAGYHPAAWRMPAAEPERMLTLDYYAEMAELCESAKLDALFFADASAAGMLWGSPFEAMTTISALVGRTRHLGLIATCSTTFNEPYTVARRLASLDQLSGGRIGWNIVTSWNESEMQNYGIASVPTHAERYARAHEFLDVAKKLWDSWDEDALVLDSQNGVFVDPARTTAIDHVGEHFDVRGPGTQPRSPQGWPVLVQAGGSEDGKQFAARHAEVIYTAQLSIEDGRAFRDEIRLRAQAAGRDPDSIKVLPGLFTLMGETEQAAHDHAAELAEQVDQVAGLKFLSQFFGDVDLSDHPLDEPPPYDLASRTEAQKSRTALIVDIARRENLTLRELVVRFAVGAGHNVVIGTYEQVADEMQAWYEAGAADGFNIQPPVLLDDLRRFTENVVPILQARGLFRHDYDATTLRGHLGLERPALGASAEDPADGEPGAAAGSVAAPAE